MGLAEDELANSFMPKDLPSSADKVYKAGKTTGNGDCLYNAVSLPLVGNESHPTLLRLPYLPADRPHIFPRKMGPKLGVQPTRGFSVLTPH